MSENSYITEEEKQKIIEYEYLVKDLIKSWEEVEQKVLESIEEAKMHQHGCCGHPSQED